MTEQVLFLLQSASYILTFIYAYLLLTFIEKLINKNNPSKIIKIILSIVSSIIYSSILETHILYGILTIFIFMIIKFIYKPKSRINMLITLTIILHIMVFHTISVSLLTVYLGESILLSKQIILYNTVTTIICSTIGIISTILTLRFFPFRKLTFGLSFTEQLNFTIAWLIMCNIFMFLNANTQLIVYTSPLRTRIFNLATIAECVIILLGVYIMVIYNLRIDSLLSQKQQNQILATQLESNTDILNALTSDFLQIYNINLSYDKLEKRNNQPLFEDTKYSEFFRENLFPLVHDDDRENVMKFIDKDALISEFKNGNPNLTVNYRLLLNNDYSWRKMVIKMFENSATGEIMAVFYTKDITREIEHSENLKQKAETDLMTGLYNRMTSEHMITKELENGCGAFIMVDIDNFKSINDTYGHDIGDQAIVNLANILKASFRNDDIIGRYGGDEFVVYLKGMNNPETLKAHANNILNNHPVTIECDGEIKPISISIGAAMINRPATFLEAFKCADTALYNKKVNGKSGYHINYLN